MVPQKFTVVITLAVLIFLQYYTSTFRVVAEPVQVQDPEINYPDPLVAHKSLSPSYKTLPPQPDEPLPESKAPSPYGACAHTIPMGNADQECDDLECQRTCVNNDFSRTRSFCIEDFLCCCMPLIITN